MKLSKIIPIIIVLIGTGFRFFILGTASPNDLGGKVDEWFMLDDSYYSLNIARNIANSGRWTHDGVNITNGFQPLYVFLMIPIYSAFKNDRLTPIFISLIILSIFNSLIGLILYLFLKKITQNQIISLIAMIFWEFSPNIIGLGINGMETSIALFFVSLIFYIYFGKIVPSSNSSLKNTILLGILGGVALLSRIDTGIVLLVIGFDLFDRLLLKEKNVKKFIKVAGIFSTISFFIFSAWLILSFKNTGKLLPESGKAVRQLSYIRGVPTPDELPSYIASNFEKAFAFSVLEAPFIPNMRMILNKSGSYYMQETNVFKFNLPVFLGFFLFIFLNLDGFKRKIVIEETKPFLFFSLVFISAYALYVYGDHYYYRYMYPLFFVVLFVFFASVSKLSRKKAASVTIVAVSIFTFNFIVESRAMFSPKEKITWGEIQLVLKKSLNLYPHEKVGAFQSGFISYADKDSSHKVINLDGVVNHNAYLAIKNKTLKKYLKQNKIRYIIDWPNMRAILYHCNIIDDRDFTTFRKFNGLEIIKIREDNLP